MYLFLLVFGGLLGAAGVILAGSGVSLRDGTFDAAILTPGIVAAAGGLLLIGLGAGLRVLQRIERTLASRPMPHVLAATESGAAAESVETRDEPARIPFAAKGSHEIQPDAAVPDMLAGMLPEDASGADKRSASIPAIAIAAGHDANAETSAQRSSKNGNGAAGTRLGLRLSPNLRRASADERASEPAVEALWPKGPRPSRAVQTASVPISQNTGVTPIQSQQSASASNTAPAPNNSDRATAVVSVLKSGVVNGMSYTLYSDGSIEAQLPEGTLRFGSITELRNHIEQSA